MSLILAAFGGLGISFGRMGLNSKTHAVAPPPGGSHPTYYILGF